MSGGLVKACVQRKNCSVPEKSEFLIIQGEVFYPSCETHSAGWQGQPQLGMSTALSRESINWSPHNTHNQQETLVHIISILNITRYATQMNRQHINIVMSAAEKTHQDVTSLYNITHSLYSSLSYQQIVLHICSILANLWDSLYYIERSCHTQHGLHWGSNNRDILTTCNYL